MKRSDTHSSPMRR